MIEYSENVSGQPCAQPIIGGHKMKVRILCLLNLTIRHTNPDVETTVDNNTCA